jgi:hypothetical protein
MSVFQISAVSIPVPADSYGSGAVCKSTVFMFFSVAVKPNYLSLALVKE